MTITLHLGNVDVPYNQDAGDDHATTGDVATYLENKYHIKEIFSEIHLQDIADDLTSGLAGALESLIMGSPPVDDPYLEGCSAIDERFRVFLYTGEMESLGYPGVPTQASKDRRNLRKKSKKSETERPSFIDTGQYEATSVSWVETESEG